MSLRTGIALALLLAAGPALACTGQSVHLDGEFKTGELGWGRTDDQFQATGREAVLTPQPGTQIARWDTATTLSDADACVTLAAPAAAKDASRTYAGLLFWLTDKDNFYEAVIAPNGMFAVARKVGGQMAATAPVTWIKADAIKTGPGDKNTLRVTLEGQSVTVRINDREVARFRGQAPAAPSHLGLVAGSGPDGADAWRMTDLKATNVAGPQTAQPAAAPAQPTTPPPASAAASAPDATGAVPAACEGKVLFADDFQAHDPTWGPKDDRLAIAAGEAVLTPVPGTRTFRWNRAFVFGDVDACATLSLAKATSDPTASYAGLIFWVEDDRNYYQAVLAPSGYFTVARVADGKVEAKRPVDWMKLDVAKTGAKERNTLRVTSKGSEVAISVNGKQVASFKGEAPAQPSHIGLLAASAPGKRSDAWSIADFKVVEPR